MARQKSKPNTNAQEQPAENSEQTTKNPPKVRNPHDSFFRHVFSNLDYVRELLQGFVSKQYISLMNLNEFVDIDSVYTDSMLTNHESDLLFRVQLNEVYNPKGDKKAPKTVDIYLLFEHKSSPESSVVLQCLRYMVTRWEYDWTNNVQPRAIIPIIFYHGEKNWNIDKQFATLFQYVDPQLQKFIPHFEYILIDLSEKSDEDITKLVPSGALQSGLLALKYIFNQGLEGKLIQILSPLQQAKLPLEIVRPLLEAIIRYLTSVKNRVSDEAMDNAVRTVFAEEEEIMESIFERLEAKARQEGIESTEEKYQKILQQERQKMLAGHRETILGIVNHKLTLDEEKQAKMIEQIERIDDEETLRDLINSALDAAFGGEFTYFMMKLMFESSLDKA
ncbi:MAG: Rpn family recombination-promoting nuclease/putative transposase [Chloroflexota bacterium]